MSDQNSKSKTTTKSVLKSSTSRLGLRALEPRILLDAAGFATGVDVAVDALQTQDVVQELALMFGETAPDPTGEAENDPVSLIDALREMDADIAVSPMAEKDTTPVVPVSRVLVDDSSKAAPVTPISRVMPSDLMATASQADADDSAFTAANISGPMSNAITGGETITSADFGAQLDTGDTSVSVTGGDGNVVTVEVLSPNDFLADDGVGVGMGRDFGAADNDALPGNSEDYRVSFADGLSEVELTFGFLNNNIDGSEEMQNFRVFDTNGNDITNSVVFTFTDNSGPITPGVGGGPLAFGTRNGIPNTLFGGAEAGNADSNGVLNISTANGEIGSITFNRITLTAGQSGVTGAFGTQLQQIDYTTAPVIVPNIAPLVSLDGVVTTTATVDSVSNTDSNNTSAEGTFVSGSHSVDFTLGVDRVYGYEHRTSSTSNVFATGDVITVSLFTDANEPNDTIPDEVDFDFSATATTPDTEVAAIEITRGDYNVFQNNADYTITWSGGGTATLVDPDGAFTQPDGYEFSSGETLNFTRNQVRAGDANWVITVPGDTVSVNLLAQPNPFQGGQQNTADEALAFSAVVYSINHTDTFTEGAGAISIADTDAIVNDFDDINIESATIVLTNAQADDILAVGALPGGITSSIDTSVAGQITVTLTNSTSEANYAAAIRAITFENTSETPDTTNRLIQVTVNDGDNNSNTALSTIEVVPVNDPPIIDLNSDASDADTSRDNSAIFSVGGGAIDVTAADAGVFDTEGDTYQVLTITPSGFVDGAAEQIIVAGQTFVNGTDAVAVPATLAGASIEIDYVAGVLSVREASDGELSEAQMEAIIQSVQYNNTSATPTLAGTRSFDFQVQQADGSFVIDFSEFDPNNNPTAAELESDPYWGADAGQGNGNVTNATLEPTYPLAVAADGNFLSHFTGGAVPAGEQVVFGRSGIAVTAGVEYSVSVDLGAANTNNAGGPFEIVVDGVVIRTINFADLPDNSFQTFTTTFIPTANTVDFEIRNVSTQTVGNDFGIDNIVFTPTTPILSNVATADVTLNAGVDTDSDGINDDVDVDDDNDGILDTNEGFIAGGGAEPADVFTPVLNPEDLTFTDNGGVGGVGDTALYSNAGTLNGQPIDVLITVIDNSNPTGINADVSGYTSGDYFAFLLTGSSPSGDVTFRMEYFEAGTNTPITAALQVTWLDIDNTGVDESLTVDTADLVAYTVDNPSNITVANDAGETEFSSSANGAFTSNLAVQTTFVSETSIEFKLGKRTTATGYSIGISPITDPQTTIVTGTPEISRDTDGDGIADHLDIDSDNDGITDNIEAQTTDGYIAPSGIGAAMTDLNQDGLDDNYDTRTVTATTSAATNGAGDGLTPVDTDGDSQADFLDTDSDNEGADDAVEGGTGMIATGQSNATTDADGDGLFDVFETQGGTTATDGFNVNESIATGAIAFPDTDGDATGTITPLSADVDFRDATTPPPNSAPVITAPATATVAEDGTLTFSPNIRIEDADSTNVTMTLSVDPAHGTLQSGSTVGGLTITGNGTGTLVLEGSPTAVRDGLETLSFTPIADFNTSVLGTIPLTITATDGIDAATPVVTNITVTAVDDTSPDTLSTDDVTAITFNVLTGMNGASADNFEGTPTVTAITQPSSGMVSIDNADGTLTYTPVAGFVGQVTFDYTVTSGGVTETETVTINVGGSNSPPVAVNDGPIDVPAGGAVIIDVLDDDSDPDSDPLTITSITDPANPSAPISLAVDTPVTLASGTIVTLLTDGTLRVVTEPSDIGAETFQYTISDGNGEEATAEVSLNVAANVQPTFACDGTIYQTYGPTFNAPTQLASVDPATGTFTNIGDTSHGLTYNGVGLNPTDNFMYGGLITAIGSDHIVRVGSNGSVTDLGPVAGLPVDFYVAGSFSPDGLYWVSDSNSDTFYAINLDTMSVVNSVTVPGSGNIFDITFTPDGLAYGYVFDAANNTNQLISFDAVTNTLTNIGAPVATFFGALYSDSTGRVFGSANDGTGLFEMDLTTGALTRIGDSPLAGANDGAFCSLAAFDAPPVIDLNSTAFDAAETGVDNAVTFTEDSGPVNIAQSDADVFDASEADIETLSIALSGFVDGASEILNLGGTDFDPAVDQTFTITNPAGDDILVTVAGGVITLTNADNPATPMDTDLLDDLVRGMSYDNSSNAPSETDRTLTFTVTDTGGQTSAAAVATLSVMAVNDAPVAPDCHDVVPGEFAEADYANFVTTDGTTPGGIGQSTLYSNIGMVDGNMLDARVTYIATSADGTTLQISGTASGLMVINNIAGAPGTTVTLQVEYFIAGTTTAAPFSGVFNLFDIDGNVNGANEEFGISTEAISSSQTSASTTISEAIDGQFTVFSGSVDGDTYGGSLDDLNVAINIENTSGFLIRLTTTGNSGFGIDGDNFSLFPGAECDVNDQGETNEDTPLVVDAANGVLINDTDADGDTLMVSQVEGQPVTGPTTVTLTSGAIVTINPDGSYEYDPNGQFESLQVGETATDTFVYQVSDGNGGFDLGTVEITINGVNDAPIAENDTVGGTENATVTFDAFANNGVDLDRDVEDDTFTITRVTTGNDVTDLASLANGDGLAGTVAGSSGGTFTVLADGTMTFDPGTDFDDLAVGETRVTEITYQIDDGNGGTDTAVVTYTVTGENDLITPQIPGDPTPPADRTDFIPDQTGVDNIAPTPLDLNTFFDDPDTSDVVTFSVTPSDLPPGLTLVNGVISGTLDDSASQGGTDGVYDIDVTVTDSNGDTFVTTVQYTVTNPAPDAVNDDYTTAEETPISVNVLTDNDSDPDGDDLSVDGATLPDGTVIPLGVATVLPAGTVTINTDGSVDFDPADGFNGDFVFNYTITDGEGGTDDATVTITVDAVNDPPGPQVPGDPNPPADPNGYIPQQTGVDGAPITDFVLTPYFTDVDNTDAELTLSLDPNDLPDGLTWDPVSETISGTPSADASQGGTDGVYTIAVTATDPDGQSFTTNVTYTITNPAPIAQDDDFVAGEDSPAITGNLITDNNGNGLDTDPDGDVLSVAEVNGDAANIGTPIAGSMGGVFTVNPDGSYSFDPNGEFEYLAAGESVTTTLNYLVSDGQGGTDLATVTVTVEGANDAPIPVDPEQPAGPSDPSDPSDPDDPRDPPVDPQDYIPAQTGEDNSPQAPLDLTPYFGDPDGSDNVTLSIDPNDLPEGLTFDGTTISGTPSLDASQGGTDGVYDIPVTATDPSGETFTTIVTYTITNPAPIAQDDVEVIDEDTVLSDSVLPDNGNGADADPDGDVLRVTEVNGTPITSGTVITLPSGALLTMNADGSYDYDPNGQFESLAVGETDMDSFTYQISDGEGGVSTATVNITIDGVNDAPIPVDPEQPAGPSDPSDPSDPDDPRDPPVDPQDYIPAQSGEDASPQTPFDLTPYFGDPDAPDPVTLSIDPNDLPPGLSFDPTTGIISGTPDLDASQQGTDGVYEVPVTATDPSGETFTTIVTYTITNPAPVAVDDSYTTPEDTPITVNILTENDSDPDGDRLVVDMVALPDGTIIPIGVATNIPEGTLTVNADGSTTFDPRLNFFGSVTFGYTISDGEGGTDVATVTLDVTPVNDAPIPVDPEQPPLDPENPDTPVDPEDPRVPPIDPQDYIPEQPGNDGNPQPPLDLTPYFGDPDPMEPLVITVGDLPPGLSFDPTTGIISGTPDPDASQGGDPSNPGTYDVPVTVTDPSGESFTTIVTYVIDNPPPVATDDGVLEVVEDTPTTLDVLGNDTDPDGDDLTITEINGTPVTVGVPTELPSGGTVTLNPDGTVSYTPVPDYNGPDSFTYTISDGEGGTDTAEVTLDVTPVNDIPVVTPPVVGEPALPPRDNVDGEMITPVDVSGPFSDIDGDPLTFTAVGLPDGLTIDSVTGVVTGTLPPGTSANGPFDVTITATDPDGESVSTEFVWTVENVPPVVVTPLPDVMVDDGNMVNLPTAPNFNDPDIDDVTYTVTGLPEGLSIDPETGVISGTLSGSASQDGPYDITVTITDSQGASTDSTFVLSVNNVAPEIGTPEIPLLPPVAGEPIMIDVGKVTGDPDGDPSITYTADDLPPGLTIDPNTGIITGSPTVPQDAPYVFTVTANDGEGGLTTIELTLQVNEDGFVEPIDPGTPRPAGDPVDPYVFLDGQPIDLQRYFADRAMDARDPLGRSFGDRDFHGGMVAVKVPGMGHDCAYMVVEAVAYEHHLNVSMNSTFPMFCNADVRSWDVDMADGSALPAWMVWQDGGDFVTINRPLDVNSVQLRIRALLDNGRSATTTVEIDLRTGTVTQVGDAYAQGQTLTQQLALETRALEVEQVEQQAESDQLIRALAG